MRQYIIIIFLSGFAFISSAQIQLALDGEEWKGIGAFEVKGRQGILIRQKLSFGNYYSTLVQRSWTKSNSSFDAVSPLREKYWKIISGDYIDRNQTLFFALQDSSRNKVDVHCVNNFHTKELTLGSSGIDLGGILGRGSVTSADVYYVQIYAGEDGPPWNLVIDNEAAQHSPATYSTRLARSPNEYYTLSPYRSVRNNKGKVVQLTFGAAGFQIRNKAGDAVAAVSTINKGVVYLKKMPKEERILLAAACAAILLQEQIAAD